MRLTNLWAQVCRISRSHEWSPIRIQDYPNHIQDTQAIVKIQKASQMTAVVDWTSEAEISRSVELTASKINGAVRWGIATMINRRKVNSIGWTDGVKCGSVGWTEKSYFDYLERQKASGRKSFSASWTDGSWMKHRSKRRCNDASKERRVREGPTAIWQKGGERLNQHHLGRALVQPTLLYFY
jgi:hypothetical protein